MIPTPLTPKQAIAQLRMSLTPGGKQAADAASAWLQVPAVCVAINDTREMGLETAAKQIRFMTGHEITIPQVEFLRNHVPAPAAATATLTQSRLSLSAGDDQKVKALWTQSHERADRMHALWDAAATSAEQRIQNGMHPSEKHLRLIALLSDSAGGAARTAASLFEVAATQNDMSITAPVSGRAPMGTDAQGRVVIDMEAVPQQVESTNADKVARWQPLLP